MLRAENPQISPRESKIEYRILQHTNSQGKKGGSFKNPENPENLKNILIFLKSDTIHTINPYATLKTL